MLWGERATLRRRFSARSIELFLIQKRLAELGARGNIVRIQRLNDTRSHHDQQFCIVSISASAFEKITKNRNIAKNRNLARDLGQPLVDQSCDSKALAVTQFNFSLRLARTQSG